MFLLWQLRPLEGARVQVEGGAMLLPSTVLIGRKRRGAEAPHLRNSPSPASRRPSKARLLLCWLRGSQQDGGRQAASLKEDGRASPSLKEDGATSCTLKAIVAALLLLHWGGFASPDPTQSSDG